MIGTVIADRYRIDSQLGVGGMGIVYRAFDTRLLREVALKVIAPHLTEQDKAAQRFMREAQALAGLTHPNIVTVFDQLEDPESGRICIIMELLQGASLRQRLKGPKRPPFEELSIQLCRALETAHAKGILHRDIKPENIFVCDDGTIKLMDFGLARILDASSSSQSSVIVGTAQYMAPEQLKGEKQDGRTDLYALGVVFYEFLTGIQPFTADNPGAIMMKHLTEMPPPISKKIKDISPATEAIVMRLLAKDPKDRYPSAHDLRDAFKSNAPAATSAPAKQAPAKIEQPVAIPITVPKNVVYPGVTSYRKQERHASKGTLILFVALLLLIGGGGAAYYFGKGMLDNNKKQTAKGSGTKTSGKGNGGSSRKNREDTSDTADNSDTTTNRPRTFNPTGDLRAPNEGKHTANPKEGTKGTPEPTTRPTESEPAPSVPETTNEHQDNNDSNSGDSEKSGN